MNRYSHEWRVKLKCSAYLGFVIVPANGHAVKIHMAVKPPNLKSGSRRFSGWQVYEYGDC